MNININPLKIFRTLLFIIFFLLIGNITANFLKFSEVASSYRIIILFLDLDLEQNLPTYYSSFALLASSFLLLIITLYYKYRKAKYLYWMGLSAIFVFLSIDEFCKIHEQFEFLTKRFINVSGFLSYAWYIPYSIILLFLIIAYYRFFIKLPKKTKLLFFISALVFIMGAIGFEATTAYYDELYGREHILYIVFYTFEELFEMIGVAIFIYALLLFISEEIKYLNLKIKTP